MAMTPDQTLDYFIKALAATQRQVCWGLFSKQSQDQFLEWTLNFIHSQHGEAAKAAGLGIPEVRLLFENNDPGLGKSFWKYFITRSNAGDFYHYGYYSTLREEGNRAVVQVLCQYPDGRRQATEVVMLKEKGIWKVGYVESNLPF